MCVYDVNNETANGLFLCAILLINIDCLENLDLLTISHLLQNLCCAGAGRGGTFFNVNKSFSKYGICFSRHA